MRLWTLHPKYLDGKGLVALWREALLAKAVLAGETKGYRHHPQLDRFKVQPEPVMWLNVYLIGIYNEALNRNYRFDYTKIDPDTMLLREQRMLTTTGQIEYEWHHLQNKLMERAPETAAKWAHSAGHQQPVPLQPNGYSVGVSNSLKVVPHPLFKIVQGNVGDFERVKAGSRTSAPIYTENGTQAI